MSDRIIERFIAVVGYGATPNLNDANYGRYLRAVLSYMRVSPHICFTVYLCGGFTNRTDLSEAECMRRILHGLGELPNARYEIIDHPKSLRDDLRAFRETVGNVPVTIFCELSRRPTVRFLASLFFLESEVIGVPFDERSLAWTHRLFQICFRLPLEALALQSKPVEDLRVWLRDRHIAQTRQQTS